MPRLYAILEGGPGVGKSSIAEIVKKRLEELGHSVCVVHDSSRDIASILSRLFGEWHRAPRDLIEYMILGHQVHGLQKCQETSPEIIVLDYNIEAPLAYMEADGISYPHELSRLAEVVLSDGFVIVFLLERPISYAGDRIRWEDLVTAQRYSRYLVWRASSLAARLGAPVYVIPERFLLVERAEIIVNTISSFLKSY